MTGGRRSSFMPGLILLILALSAFCGLAGPCYASDEVYESRLNQGLSNIEPYSYLLIEKAAADKAREKELLESARKYAPDLPAVYFKLALKSLSPSVRGILQSIDYFRQGINAYSRNFWWRFSLSGLLYIAVLISFVFAMLITLAIRFPMEANLFVHDASEDKKRWLLLLVVIALSFLGPVAFIAGAFFIIGFYFKKWSKSVVYLSFLFLLLSPVIINRGGIFLSIPSPEIRAAVAVNEKRDNKFAMTALKDKTDFPFAFSYALALKKEEQYEEALNVYKKLATTPYMPDARVLVNMGNAYYAVKNLEAANESYKQSLKLSPLASAYYNLSQTHREMLNFPKGDEYFNEAAKLSAEAVSQFSAIMSPNPNRFIADETLPPAFIWEYAAGDKGRAMPAVFLAIVGLAIVITPAFYLIDSRTKHRAKRCKKCGTIFCAKCTKSIAAISMSEICHLCYRSLIKIDAVDSRERINRLLITYQSKERKRKTAKILSVIVPGSGQIFAGEITAGFLLLWPFLFSLTALAMRSFFSIGLSSFGHSWLMFPLMLVIGLTYAISIIHMLNGVRKGWL